MEEIKVETVNALGEKLVGTKTIPDVKMEKYPTVILVHGFGVTKEEGGMFDALAEAIAKEGILVFRFDFSGRGESEGNYIETSLTKQRDELAKIIEFVRSQDDVDNERLGIHAQSFGTAVTIALHPKLKCLILMGSMSELREKFKDAFDEYNPQGISRRKKSDGKIIEVKPQFWESFKEYDSTKFLKEFHCPTLFIHGENDTSVPLASMEECFEAANEPKEKFVIEGADHGLRPHRDIMYKKAAEWFRKWLIN